MKDNLLLYMSLVHISNVIGIESKTHGIYKFHGFVCYSIFSLCVYLFIFLLRDHPDKYETNQLCLNHLYLSNLCSLLGLGENEKNKDKINCFVLRIYNITYLFPNKLKVCAPPDIINVLSSFMRECLETWTFESETLISVIVL